MSEFYSSYQFLNMLGLFFDLVGIVIIFFFALPHFPELDSYTEIKLTDKAKRKYRNSRLWAYTGLIFLIAGLVLQILSSYNSFY